MILLALGVRLVFVACTSHVPTLRHLVGDAAGYHEWARRIAAGEWLGTESFYQAPLYPYLLAIIMRVAGDGVWVIRVVQACWGAMGVGCLYLATQALGGRRSALVAAIMLALYPPAIFADGTIQKTSLGGLLTCVLLALVTRRRSGQQPWSIAGVGVVAALMVLTRENAIVWLALLALWVWTLPVLMKRRRWGALIMLTLGAGVVLGPVALRNKRVGGEWSVSTFQAGPNFYIGNGKEADGRYRPLVRGHETPEFERTDATRLAERALGASLTPRQVSRYWQERALKEMAADPARWLRLMMYKTLLTWNRYEIADAESQPVYAEASTPFWILSHLWHFGVLAPLAAMGIVVTLRRWRRWWLVYAMIASMAAAVALFYVLARYRFAFVPLLLPLAAVGCTTLAARWRRRDYRGLAGPAVVGILVAVMVNVPVQDERRLDALAWMNAGVAAAQEGDLEAALPHFERAVRDHPQSAEAQYNLALALSLREEFARAVEHYRAALAIAPELVGVDFNLGVALERCGRADEALRHFERAVQLDPTDEEAAAAVDRLRGGR